MKIKIFLHLFLFKLMIFSLLIYIRYSTKKSHLNGSITSIELILKIFLVQLSDRIVAQLRLSSLQPFSTIYLQAHSPPLPLPTFEAGSINIFATNRACHNLMFGIGDD